MEGVVFDGGSGEESGGYCFIEFEWCEDMVENGFVCFVTEKSANDVDDGFDRLVHVEIEDREVR